MLDRDMPEGANNSAAVDWGSVSLVGAGPGDVGLLTVRGRELLEACDVVVYDALANPKLLELCKANCQMIYVGKRAGQHAMPQEQINQLLVDQAKLGRQVVRLKGGDPFVFGRGGEECQALAGAGVTFEVVPGITSAIAAAAYAGIPATHRHFNNSVTLVTGHESVQNPPDYATLAKLPCLMFYMGVKALPSIARGLIDSGMDPSTPAAVVQSGTYTHQKTVVARLDMIAQEAQAAGIAAPAVTIVGEVVSLRQSVEPSLRWFDNRPLTGKTVLVTRSRDQISQLTRKLQDQGARVIEAPTIEVETNFRVELEPLFEVSNPQFDWLVFTSPNGPRAVREWLDARGLDVRLLGRVKIAVVGQASAASLRTHLGLIADVVSSRAVSESLVEELAKKGFVKEKRFLLLRANLASGQMGVRLKELGAIAVHDVPVYSTRQAKSLPIEATDALDQGLIDCATFTSGSTVENLARLLGVDYARRLQRVRLVSIGPTTTRAIARLGLTIAQEAKSPDLDSLVNCVACASGSDSF